ncbi:hypothetical protein ACSSS7_003660 [Eimeria intestinalis]
MLRRLLLARAAAVPRPLDLVGVLAGPAGAQPLAPRLSAASEKKAPAPSKLTSVCSAAAAPSCPCSTSSLSCLGSLHASCSRGGVPAQHLGYFHSAAAGERRTRLRRINSEDLKSSSSSSSSGRRTDDGGGDLIVSCGPRGNTLSELLGYEVAESPSAVLPRSRRHAISRKPLLPIEPRNLRQPGLRKKKRRRGRGDKSSAKGIRLKRDQQGRFKGPRIVASAAALAVAVADAAAAVVVAALADAALAAADTAADASAQGVPQRKAIVQKAVKTPSLYSFFLFFILRRRKRWDHLNLSKLRKFLEQGRLDARYPITQRHLHDSRCVKVKNGVHLFNVNDYPFPYKITIDVASADQSSIDAIRRVGGEARPGLEAVHFLEKMRARGCVVSYVRPQWLEAEEKRLQAELQELQAEAAAAAGEGVSADARALRVDAQAVSAYRAKGLRISALENQQNKNNKVS